MEIEFPKTDSISDITTTPGFIYVGKAPIGSSVDDPLWIITKTSLTSPFEKRFGKSLEQKNNVNDRLKNKWVDRVSLIY